MAGEAEIIEAIMQMAATSYGVAEETGDPFASFVSSLGPLGGTIGGLSAYKEKKKKLKKIRAGGERALQGGLALDQLYSNLQESALKSATEAQLGGLKGSKRAAELGASDARRTILNREKQVQGSLQQRLISSGLGDTTTGANLQMGLAGQTSQQLADIDTQLAQIFGDLNIAEGNIRAGGFEGLMELLGSSRGFGREISQARFGLATIV